jgi:DNA-binding NarL/FixJ family response regulator
MTRYMLKNDPETMEQIRVLISEGLRVPQIAQKINLNMTTIRKFIKENNLEYITRRGVCI